MAHRLGLRVDGHPPSNEENRNGEVTRGLFRDASMSQSVEAAPAVGRQDDQVDAASL
jgi:hypothetical protein